MLPEAIDDPLTEMLPPEFVSEVMMPEFEQPV